MIMWKGHGVSRWGRLRDTLNCRFFMRRLDRCGSDCILVLALSVAEQCSTIMISLHSLCKVRELATTSTEKSARHWPCCQRCQFLGADGDVVGELFQKSIATIWFVIRWLFLGFLFFFSPFFQAYYRGSNNLSCNLAAYFSRLSSEFWGWTFHDRLVARGRRTASCCRHAANLIFC